MHEIRDFQSKKLLKGVKIDDFRRKMKEIRYYYIFLTSNCNFIVVKLEKITLLYAKISIFRVKNEAF